VLHEESQADLDQSIAHGCAAFRLRSHASTLQTIGLFAKQTSGL
jgi:hypothetical protein